MNTSYAWTLVQHRAYGIDGIADYRYGLQPARVTTRGQKARIARLGGLLFSTLEQAEAFCVSRAVIGWAPQPRATGRFVHYYLDGLKMFVPTQIDDNRRSLV